MKKRICIITASEMTVRAFLLDQLRELAQQYDVTVVTNSNQLNLLAEYGIKATVIHVPISRRIAPLKDLWALYLLWRLFRLQQFNLVHSVTPKAGLLSMMASRLAGIDVRIHTFTGQVWATKKGVGRWLLKHMDWLLATCASHILVDSASQRDFILAEGVVSAEKSVVLASGSISGVNLSRFHPRRMERMCVREALAIPQEAIVYLFVGRLNKDKGVLDLARAFAQLGVQGAEAHLLLVGADEAGMLLEIENICAACHNQVHFVNFTKEPEYYMNAADVFCLPSYREGFGSVVIEAGASGIPSIGSRIYGITDSIVGGETGFLFPPGDVAALERQMVQFIANPDLCVSMGKQARDRVQKLFASDLLTKALMGFYRGLLK